MEWLRETLADGPVRSSEIRFAAKRDGIAWHTVERAKGKLDVIALREGFGAAGAWSWSLPGRGPDDDQPTSIGRQPPHRPPISESGGLWTPPAETPQVSLKGRHVSDMAVYEAPVAAFEEPEELEAPHGLVEDQPADSGEVWSFAIAICSSCGTEMDPEFAVDGAHPTCAPLDAGPLEGTDEEVRSLAASNVMEVFPGVVNVDDPAVLIAGERARGRSDEAIARFLQTGGWPPPNGFRDWTRYAVRTVAEGETR